MVSQPRPPAARRPGSVEPQLLVIAERSIKRGESGMEDLDLIYAARALPVKFSPPNAINADRSRMP